MRDKLKQSQKIVIKAGTSMLTTPEGRISSHQIEKLGGEIIQLLEQRKQAVLVSSGAIAFGMEACGLKKRPRSMHRLQACAAVGQGKLMHAYEAFFSRYGVHTGQLLLTRDGLELRRRFLTARHTLQELFAMKTLPIVNENDTVATEEIAFGDNDILSVQVAHLIGADLLIVLSDTDGFFLKDGSRIRQVNASSEIDGTLVRHLRDVRKEKTVGGMAAKLEAAKTAMKLGVPLVIVGGREKDVIQRVLEGEDIGTLFSSEGARKNSRQKWIAFSAARKGTVVVDDGAYEALLEKKRSLLPRGMVGVRGTFQRGEIVELEKLDGCVFGRGLVRYSSRELSQIAGKKTDEIQAVLGYKHQDEVIHRNDLVIWS